MANSSPLHDVRSISIASSRPLRRKSPLIYWHLLSLDAPTVATLWTWFIARCSGIRLPAYSILAMGFAVWILYAADRLLDTSSPTVASEENLSLEPRHYFHRLHRKAFRIGIAAASLALVYPVEQLPRRSIELYATLATPLLAYLLLVHQKSGTTRPLVKRLPKEIAVGVFFSAATFIPTVARVPGLRLVLLPAAILFGLLCSLNCLYIYAWEHPQTCAASYPEAHTITRLALRSLPLLTLATILAAAALPLIGSLRPSGIASATFAAAIALAAAFLLLLHARRSNFDKTTLRVAADLCLLTPLLFTFALPS